MPINITKTHITILSTLCIDHNLSEHTTYVGAGSPAIFMARVFLQIENIDTSIISKYGADFLPYRKNFQILPAQPTSYQTLIYENDSTTGTRIQKALFRGNSSTVKLSTEIKHALNQSQIFLFAPLLPIYSSRDLSELMASLPKSTLKILLPQGYFRQFDQDNVVHSKPFTEASEILPLFDLVILSNQDFPGIEEIAQSWTTTYNLIVIVTKAEAGCLIFSPNQIITVPVEPVPLAEIVDSVGSGDIFGAIFAYSFWQHHDLKKAAELANKVARENLFYSSDHLQVHVD